MINLFNKTKKYQDINAEEFSKLSKNPDTVILDVRTGGEVSEGKIPGAININVMNFLSFGSEIDKLDRDKTYLVYCRSGNRSGNACQMMQKKGFTKLYNLSGGVGAWRGKLV
jgi:rhodanese-related sulfurtransferase